MRNVRPILAASVLLAALGGLSACTAISATEKPAHSVSAPAPKKVDPSLAKASSFQNPVGVTSTQVKALTPTRVIIPSIQVNADLLPLSRGSDGVLQPPPPTELSKAGWYAAGTIPGQVGPAVIAGHVDWVKSVAVFHRLGDLNPGDKVKVVMSDHSTVTFTVDRVTHVSKFHFPTNEVYGPTPDPQLRLITCGGPWDNARNIYSQNVVVYATEQS